MLKTATVIEWNPGRCQLINLPIIFKAFPFDLKLQALFEIGLVTAGILRFFVDTHWIPGTSICKSISLPYQQHGLLESARGGQGLYSPPLGAFNAFDDTSLLVDPRANEAENLQGQYRQKGCALVHALTNCK